MGLAAGEYLHVCIDKSGSMHRGYVRKKGSGAKEVAEALSRRKINS